MKEDWLQWFTNFFDKKSAGSGAKSMPNQQLANELHKQMIRKFKRRQGYFSFKDNICSADVADMQLISKYDKVIGFLLCFIDLFSKYVLVVPLKDKKGAAIAYAFQSILNDSERKPNKIWVDQGSEFYNKSFKKGLDDNDKDVFNT